jgi:hypothetical protein
LSNGPVQVAHANLSPASQNYVALRRGAEDLLLFRERRQYLAAVQDALAGGEAARVVLAGVVKRMERG